MLSRAACDGLWDVFMIAFHMMQERPKNDLSADAREAIGTLLMFAVRSIYSLVLPCLASRA
jgi:hypothetical protein